jgi:hypothetical protein
LETQTRKIQHKKQLKMKSNQSTVSEYSPSYKDLQTLDNAELEDLEISAMNLSNLQNIPWINLVIGMLVKANGHEIIQHLLI